MEKDNNKLIRRYLDDEMTEQEKEQFKIQLSNDEQLKEDLQTELLIDAAKVELQKEEFKQFDKVIQRERKSKIVVIISLVVVILSIVGYFIISQNQSRNSNHLDELYATYLNEAVASDLIIKDGVINERVADAIDETIEVNLKNGIKEYNDANYVNAVEDFNTILKLSPLLIEVRFYRGVAHYEIRDYTTALEDFSFVDEITTVGNNRVLKTNAIWYKAFTQLRLNDQTAATETFKRLQPFEEYNEKVNQILEQLNTD